MNLLSTWWFLKKPVLNGSVIDGTPVTSEVVAVSVQRSVEAVFYGIYCLSALKTRLCDFCIVSQPCPHSSMCVLLGKL